MDLYTYYLYNNTIKFEHNLDNIRSELKVSYLITITLKISKYIRDYLYSYRRRLTNNTYDYLWDSTYDSLLYIDGIYVALFKIQDL